MLVWVDQTLQCIDHENQTIGVNHKEAAVDRPLQELLHRVQDPRLDEIPAGDQKGQVHFHEKHRPNACKYDGAELEVATKHVEIVPKQPKKAG